MNNANAKVVKTLLDKDNQTTLSKCRKSRKKHNWQKKIDKSVIFASDLKEDLFTGPRTTLEYLVVGEIIKFCLSNGLECERDGTYQLCTRLL